MNNELRHANYKYIKREWKNGKWQYTYENSAGIKGKSSSDPVGARSSPQKKIDNETTRAKLTTVKTKIGTNTPGAPKKYLADHVLGTGKGVGDTRRIKSTGPVREDGPDDQNEAAKYISGNADKKTSKSAMPRDKKNMPKIHEPQVKSAMQKTTDKSVKNEKSLVDKAKDTVDKVKDKLGMDEREEMLKAHDKAVDAKVGLEIAKDEAYDAYNITGGSKYANKLANLSKANENFKAKAKEYYDKQSEYQKTPLGKINKAKEAGKEFIEDLVGKDIWQDFKKRRVDKILK